MDLASMLNERPAPEKRSSTLQSESRGSTAAPLLSPSPSMQNGSISHPGASYAVPRHPQGQQTPLYTPQPASHPQTRTLTPLHTPSQAPGGGQYPFPSQAPPLQSPASAHPSQQPPYRSFEPQSATTPGPRPPSHGYSFAHRSPSMGQYHQVLNPQTTTSLSPTPSSHHSQTPHSLRQSPMAGIPAMGQHPPTQQGPLQSQVYHHSQPNTPLGPPQLPQRYSNSQLDVSSPHHSRTLSSASSVVMAGSPQHHGSINSIVESPSLLNRPSPHMRRTSDYRSSLDRDRSVSVSPKTMVPPRSSSHGSRHSSQQDMYSARSSQQASVSMAPHSETHGHVQPQTPNYPQPSHSILASEVTQNKPNPSSNVGLSMNGNSLSQMDNKVPLQHQPQKMGMSHLLAPTDHAQEIPFQNGTPNHSLPPKANGLRQSHEHSLPPAASHGAAPPMQQQVQAQAQAKPGFTQDHSTLIPNGSASRALAKPSPAVSEAATMSRSPAIQLPSKRPAEGDISAPAPKRRRRQRDRPIWARLAPQNPRASSISQPQQQSQQQPQQQPMVQAPKPAPPASSATVARVDGRRWEKSFRNMEPLPALNKAILDHLWSNLQANSDIGYDPKEGTIEIEAKIGTLKDVDTQNRWGMRSLNTIVIDPQDNRKFRFESEMNESEHKSMNAFLNLEVRASHEDRTRIKIDYAHTRETDHFQPLSDVGLRALPEAVHRRQKQWGRDLKLRTSTSDKDGSVTGRIVKIKIGEDLHIFGAREPYDVRISMNLEVNLADRPDLEPLALVNNDGPPIPPRQKDRLSYKHLAYHVDLTRVDTPGMPPKYELELEVDANVLRQQMALTAAQQPNNLTDVVEGFVNNMTLLMRQPRAAQP